MAVLIPCTCSHRSSNSVGTSIRAPIVPPYQEVMPIYEYNYLGLLKPWRHQTRLMLKAPAVFRILIKSVWWVGITFPGTHRISKVAHIYVSIFNLVGPYFAGTPSPPMFGSYHYLQDSFTKMLHYAVGCACVNYIQVELESCRPWRDLSWIALAEASGVVKTFRWRIRMQIKHHRTVSNNNYIYRSLDACGSLNPPVI